MIERKGWDEFRKTGLLLIINQILHIFGWAIVMDMQEGEVVSAYPARVKFRGFAGNCVDEAYLHISQYMSNNHNELLNETIEGIPPEEEPAGAFKDGWNLLTLESVPPDICSGKYEFHEGDLSVNLFGKTCQDSPPEILCWLYEAARGNKPCHQFYYRKKG
jgi:hypothetical protein